MGIVYGARDGSDREVAIKVLDARHTKPPDAIARFKRECEVTARLRHPNIVSVLDFGVDDGRWYLVMELLEGVTLARAIRERKSFDPPDMITILDGVLAAVVAAHEHGLVHRDLKSSNIFLAQESDRTVVKLLDFGIVHGEGEGFSTQLTRTGFAVGTPQYMAPEQYRCERVDGRTDLYALGCVAFEMLCGRTPFEGKRPNEIGAAILYDVPPTPSHLRRFARGGYAIDQFILRALEKDPDKRYANVAQMRVALSELASAIGAAAACPSPTHEDVNKTAEGHCTDAIGQSREAIDEPAPDTEVSIGARIGEYMLMGLLGSGGMGQVFLAVHPVIGKQVAIKVLSAVLSKDRTMAARFVREARAAIEIGHRNIIEIFSFGELPSGRQYFVMEYLPGESLRERLQRSAPLPLGEGLPILIEVCDALAAAHASGIVHRDLKPDNIYIAQLKTGEKRVKVLDFGIAKLIRNEDDPSQTKTGLPIGTPLYMAPEQCLGLAIDARTDVYSFGIVLYQVLTGQRPFGGESFIRVMNAQIEQSPLAPSELVPLPRELEQLILRCLAKAPEARPQTIDEVASALREILASIGAETWSAEHRKQFALLEDFPSDPGEHLSRRRNRSLAALPLALVGFAGMVVFARVHFHKRAEASVTVASPVSAAAAPSPTPPPAPTEVTPPAAPLLMEAHQNAPALEEVQKGRPKDREAKNHARLKQKALAAPRAHETPADPEPIKRVGVLYRDL